MGNAASDLYTSVVQTQRKTKNRSRKAQPPGREKVVCVEPGSADEIAEILLNPEQYPTPVRPVGSESTTTRATRMAFGTRMDMGRLNHVLGSSEHTITVQAGMRLCDLAEHLSADGLELVGSGADLNRTVGGAISSPVMAMATEGGAAQFAASVISLTLINTHGRKVEVSNRTRELLSLVRTSYGLLGVIYSATLKVRPKIATVARHTKVDFAEFTRLLPVFAKKTAALHASCYPFRDRVHIEQHVADSGHDAATMLPWRIRDWASTTVLPKVAEQSGRFKRLVLAEEVTNSVWFFPVSRFPAAFMTYQKFCARHYRETRFRCDLPAEVWYVGRDESSLLSPCFDSPAFVLNIRSTRRDGWDDFALGFAEFAAHFHGAPVFNQTPAFRPGYARRIYAERLHQFRAMRQKLDPEDRLLNQYFAEHLG